MVAGFAIGGGHVLHLCCDLTIAADNARFGQTGPRGLVRRRLRHQPPGPADRRETGQGVWFLCRQYDATTALEWGLINAVVPVADLERVTVEWCREMLGFSPLARGC